MTATIPAQAGARVVRLKKEAREQEFSAAESIRQKSLRTAAPFRALHHAKLVPAHSRILWGRQNKAAKSTAAQRNQQASSLRPMWHLVSCNIRFHSRSYFVRATDRQHNDDRWQ